MNSSYVPLWYKACLVSKQGDRLCLHIVSTLARTIENGGLVAFVDFMFVAIWKRAYATHVICLLPSEGD